MIPAEQGSALDRWRSQRKQIADRLASPLDLHIEGYDEPELWMRCRRITPDELNGIGGDDGFVVAQSADALSLACTGLYEGHPSIGRLIAERTATGRNPFDVLLEQWGEESGSARDAVCKVLVDEYEVTRLGGLLAQFSSQITAKAAEEHRGE